MYALAQDGHLGFSFFLAFLLFFLIYLLASGLEIGWVDSYGFSTRLLGWGREEMADAILAALCGGVL